MSAPTRPPHSDANPRNDDRPRVSRTDEPTVYVSRRRSPVAGHLPHLPNAPKIARPQLDPIARRVRPFGIASAVAAGWAAGMGLIVVGIPVVLFWALAGKASSSARDSIVMSADVWLAAHHVDLFVGGARVGLLPLGLLLVPFLLLRLSTSWATRILRPASLADAGLLVGTTSILYGLLAGLVAALAGRPELHVPPVEAALGCAAVAALCSGWTVLRVSGLGADLVDRVPGSVRALVRPAASGVLAVIACATVVTVVSLVVRGGEALALTRALDAGLVGGVALVVLSLLYLPNLIVWAAAFCLGPGFAVGAGTSVTLAGISTGPLPAFPLFAAIPSSGVPAAWAWLFLLVPVLGGVLTARSTVRQRPGLDPETTALWAGVGGAVAGLVLGGLAWLAGGPLGDGRLSVVGPSPWQVAALAALELGLVAAVAGWISGWRATRT